MSEGGFGDLSIMASPPGTSSTPPTTRRDESAKIAWIEEQEQLKPIIPSVLSVSPVLSLRSHSRERTNDILATHLDSIIL